MTSSAHEKSIIDTCEKSMTVRARSCDSLRSCSINWRTARPVPRVTRFEYKSQASVWRRTLLMSMWFITAPFLRPLLRE